MDVIVRWADITAASRADRYFDLTSEQKSELKENIQNDIAKMRKEMFPEVAKTFRSLEPEIKKEQINKDLVSKNFIEIQSYFKKGTNYFKDTALKTVGKLKKSQFEHFAKKVREDITETQENNETPEKSLKASYKRYRRSLEFWIGGISVKQQDEIENFLKANPYPWQLQNKSREHSLKLFLEASHNPGALQKFVADYFVDYETSRLPEFNEALNKHKAAFQTFLTEQFWKGLSTSQKNVLRDNLISRADDLDKIAQRP
ncbi:hypothetical protein Bdt_2611 [Bdellovibrio bacteriovorus str. Tiberius]|uniref:Uncharacterized protein n=1 Tax=Bdellovibrio bacteriovorus str. Tiberius TaxID=1069642 RepID=K7YX89_BDEBC|nr:hypothetical protein Bdt_2611 [Bdellovibrio bacteriovorus str. Tiberius]